MTRRQAGFTLLEVLVATVVMAVAITGIFSALAGSMRNAARLTEKDRAAMLGRRKMDELIVEKRMPRHRMFEGLYDRVLTGGEQAGWRAIVQPFEIPPNPSPGIPVLDRIRVEIWWIAAGQRRTYTVDSYRKSYYTAEEIKAGLLRTEVR